ncbi:serine/threonine protein phosphatase [Dysgonomonas sp. 521]|uniref:calcineurin-like phosphoesterase C-terminal domain-containing protein n=1 Tax=Dysgonomonas sp. 521 TaxID=2302932 RepID=UPI0013D8166D|nr:calcineurin-like phosphoesterase family protein [Dysgonomonas sp. 521]NDV96363.1 serine/threonine protein phosphatase [Dysgonomonas sp. 521]
MRRLIIYILSIFLFTGYNACIYGQCTIRGKVTCNGIGVNKVVVTDGIRCVETSENGEYAIPSLKPTRFVYISTPSGYIPAYKDKTIPQFYKAVTGDTDTYDFEIYQNPKNDTNHLFIAQADVQLVDNENLESYKKILNDCKSLVAGYSDKDIFGVDCGDIVGDTPSLYPAYIQASSILDFPVYRAIGNHDMDYFGRSHETSTKTFENYFGPVYYSFNKGNAHYIVIDNTFFVGRDYFYLGYIDEKTYAWIEQDLSYVEKGAPVFIIMHIPSRLEEKQAPFKYEYSGLAGQTINISALYEMLKPYNAHIITGHMHYNHNIAHSSNIMEHNTGAVCGTWWRGDICLDGTPQGYGVYEVNGNDVKWYFKSSGFDKEHQFRAYRPGASSEFPEDIIVNVWNWDKNWKVEWLEDGKVQGEMVRFTGIDPDAKILCSDREKVKYDWISPVTTPHLFRAIPKNRMAKLSIKVTDCFGNVYQQEIKQ